MHPFAEALAALIAARELCLRRMEAVVIAAETEARVFTYDEMTVLSEVRAELRRLDVREAELRRVHALLS